jgi:hypothetical protein
MVNSPRRLQVGERERGRKNLYNKMKWAGRVRRHRHIDPLCGGTLLIFIALFFSDSVEIVFKIFPNAIPGVILFFAGSELAIVVKYIGEKKPDFYVMLIVASLAMWNMGAAFLAGIISDNSLRRGWIKI